MLSRPDRDPALPPYKYGPLLAVKDEWSSSTLLSITFTIKLLVVTLSQWQLQSIATITV